MNEVLAQRYAELCRTESDIFEHLPTFVHAVAELGAGRAEFKIIELGTRYGVSTIAWLHALDLLRPVGAASGLNGHLWAVDCSFPVPAPGSDVNLLDPQGPLGVIPWFTFMLGYDTWPQILDALPQSDVDIVFIDTNHVYEETLIELELYYPRVRKGGRIYLHDTALETTGNATTPQPPFPVRTAMEEFCAGHRLRSENNPSCFGLGTIFC